MSQIDATTTTTTTRENWPSLSTELSDVYAQNRETQASAVNMQTSEHYETTRQNFAHQTSAAESLTTFKEEAQTNSQSHAIQTDTSNENEAATNSNIDKTDDNDTTLVDENDLMHTSAETYADILVLNGTNLTMTSSTIDLSTPSSSNTTTQQNETNFFLSFLKRIRIKLKIGFNFYFKSNKK